MPYSAEISRRNPTAFFFMLDQSYSMNDLISGGNNSKAAMLATVINRLLNEIVLRCTSGEEVRRYFDVAMIGYGNPDLGSTGVGSAFGGALAGRDIVSIADLADQPIRVDQIKKKVPDGAGGLVEMIDYMPIWVEPAAVQNTPMQEAMSYTFNLVTDWVTAHRDAFPPIVINVTDGESNDGDPTRQAEAIRALSTSDGNVLMFSLHLSSQSANPILFPNDPRSLPDAFAQQLFGMSSPLPDKWSGIAAETMNIRVSPGARAFIFNANAVAMTQFLEMGTRQPTTVGP